MSARPWWLLTLELLCLLVSPCQPVETLAALRAELQERLWRGCRTQPQARGCPLESPKRTWVWSVTNCSCNHSLTQHHPSLQEPGAGSAWPGMHWGITAWNIPHGTVTGWEAEILLDREVQAHPKLSCDWGSLLCSLLAMPAWHSCVSQLQWHSHSSSCSLPSHPTSSPSLALWPNFLLQQVGCVCVKFFRSGLG